jgi:UDP:flavonoid glycosyltransferase YjiC (YdhE family)
MSRLAWACWDGGGNLPPSLGIARELRSRGHDVRFYGRPEMVPRVRAAGLDAVALESAYSVVDRFDFHPQATVFGYTSSPVVGAELTDRIRDDSPDAVVIDAMFAAALEVAPEFGRPAAVMLHTFLYHLVEMWRGNFRMQSESRERAGFPPLASVDRLWGDRERLHVNTAGALDAAPTPDWAHVSHGAPVLYCEARMSAPLPEIPTSRDVILVSYSTVPEQRSVERLQRTLDALADLPAHVLACTGGTIDAASLEVPANADILGPSDHDALMARARVVVGHGGHGTTMRALRAGLPMVCIPATGGDQAPISRLIDEWGVGRALRQDSDRDAIRRAVVDVLESPQFAAEAQQRGAAIRGTDGARAAADAVEELLT